jgi:hypothetical protein
MSYRTLTWVYLLLLPLTGCGGDGRIPVSGAVHWEGKPLEDGRIAFTPSGDAGKRPQASGPIRDGKYSIPAAEGPMPGSYRVEVFSLKKTGKKVPTPGDPSVFRDEEKETLPAEFNKASKLTVNFESGKQVYDFDLKK